MLSGHETRTPGFVLGDGSSLDHPRTTTCCRPGHRNKIPGFVWVTAAHSITPGNNMLSGHETRTPGFVLGDGSSLDHPRKTMGLWRTL